MTDWETTIRSLKIPAEYARFPNLLDEPGALNSLNTWRNNIHLALDSLQELITQKRATGGQLRDATLAEMIFYVSPFAIESEADGLDLAPWSTQQTQYTAQEIMSIPQISQPTPVLLRQVLLVNLKPIFSSNPHPYIHSDSGRTLTRPAGGPGASQDYYDEQTWKKYPGIWSIIAWVVRNIPPQEYGNLWHLLIPPIMTLLDDYQAKHKLEGVKVVYLMLLSIPNETLQRTGIDALFFNSLKTSLSHLTDPETPTLLRLSILTWLNLTLKISQPNSSERFNHLCTLLGNCIIENVWLYSEDNVVAMRATLDGLPDVVRTLNIGTVRYLKSLVPQLAHLLATKSPNPSQSQASFELVELQKSAGRLLLVIMEVCSPRLDGWKFTILDCVARCWVGLVDSGAGGADPNLQAILKDLMSRLADICPDISQNAYQALLTQDQSIFGSLVGAVRSQHTANPDDNNAGAGSL